jgi:hypothetical protein
MLRGKRVFGLREQKCFDLLARYGNRSSFSASVEDGVNETAEYSFPVSHLSADRKIFLRVLNKALAFIPRPTVIA